jgi:hypothetical protein
LTDREALAREFSPENIAANRPIVDREPLTLSLSLRTIVPATSKTNERRIPWTLASERRTRLASLVASAVAVVPAPGVLMVRPEPESVLPKAT